MHLDFVLNIPAFAWAFVGENVKPQNFLNVFLSGSVIIIIIINIYYNKFKLTFLVNTKSFSYEALELKITEKH